MVKEEEDNISRLFLLLHLITPDVLYRFFKTVILKGEDFEKYLENKKHTIFHLHHTIACCEKGCTIEKLKQQKVLSAEQFNLLFCETAREDKSHVKRLNGKLVQKCMCGIAPVVHVMVDVMDITLICCIIKTCENVQKSEEDRLQTIRNVRNKIVHSSNILNMSTLEFNNFWTKLEGALRGLAESVSVDYEKEINGRIYYTKRRSIFESFPIEQIKIIFQQLQDKITEKEVTKRSISKNEEENFTAIHCILTRMAETLDRIQMNTSQRHTTIRETDEEHTLREIINHMQIFKTETKQETIVESPSTQIGNYQVKIHMDTFQHNESTSCEKEEHGLREIDKLMECCRIDKRELKRETINDDHSTQLESYSVEILDNFQLKSSLYCASNNNELEEHSFGHRENLVKSFQMHNAERHHETTDFSQYTGNDSGMKLHMMDNILKEMKRLILRNNMMTPAEVITFIDLLLEKSIDTGPEDQDSTFLYQRQSTTTDHSHCLVCFNQNCNEVTNNNSCEMTLCKCGIRLHVCKLTDHEIICQNKEVACINKNYGCKVTLLRSKLKIHLEKCPASVLVCSSYHGSYMDNCSECKETKIPNANIGNCQHFRKCEEHFRRDEISWHLKNVHIDICEEQFGSYNLICPYNICGCKYAAVKYMPEKLNEIASFSPNQAVIQGNIPLKISEIINWTFQSLHLKHAYLSNVNANSVCQPVLLPGKAVVPMWERKLSSWSIVDFENITTSAVSPIKKWEPYDVRAYLNHISKCPYKPNVEELVERDAQIRLKFKKIF